MFLLLGYFVYDDDGKVNMISAFLATSYPEMAAGCCIQLEFGIWFYY